MNRLLCKFNIHKYQYGIYGGIAAVARRECKCCNKVQYFYGDRWIVIVN